MRHNTSVRRSVALAAATALISGGLATGLAAPAHAAGSITSFSPTQWDNRSTVRMTVTGTGFPASGPVNSATLLFTPTGTRPGGAPFLDTANEVSQFVVDSVASTSTSVTADVDLSMAPPGQYTIQVADANGSNASPPAATTFLVYAFGSANATGVKFGPDPSGSEIECTFVTSCESRALPGTTPLDINGSNIAIGAKVRFLKLADNAPDSGISFIQNNPNNSENNLGTEDADNRDGTGYASSSLLQGNYFTAPDALAGVTPGFTPGFHKLQVVNTDGQADGATVDFAQPWFVDKTPTTSPLSPSGTGVGAKNVVVTLTGQGIRSGSTLAVESRKTSSCAGVTAGPSTVDTSSPDPAHPGTYTKISAPVSMADCTTDDLTARAVTVISPDGARFSRPGLLQIVISPTFGAISSGYDVLGQGARVGHGTEDVNITGTNFKGVGETDPAKMTKFSFGDGVTVTTLAVTSPGNAKVAIDVAEDAPTGDRVATVINPDGGSSTKSGDYLPSGDPDPFGDPAPLSITDGPKVTRIQPSNVLQSDSKTITITGTFDSADSYVVRICDAPGTLDPCTETPNVSEGGVTDTSTTLTFAVSTLNATSGARDLLVLDTTDKGRFYCVDCFGIDSVKVTPATAPNSGDQQFTFEGPDIDEVTSASTAVLTRVVPVSGQNPIPLKTGTSLTPGAAGSNTASGTFSLAGAVPGKYSVLIVKDSSAGSQTWSCSGCVTVTGPPPTTATIDRYPTSDGTADATTSGGQGATDLQLKITGSNFTPGMQVVIPDVTVHDLTLVSSSELRFQADVPRTATPGSRPVTVKGADDSTAGGTALAFVVTAAPTPTAGTLSPAALGQGAGTATYQTANGNAPVTITIKGVDFQSGAQLDLGPDIQVTEEAVTQGTNTCILPGVPPGCGLQPDTLTAKVLVAQVAAVGKRAAVVTNPDGGTGTVPEAFTVNQGPKITSVANAAGFPALIPDGQPHPITVLGSGFSTSTPPADVLDVIPADGITIANVVVVDAGKITANITAASNAVKGARTVGVTNTNDKGFGGFAPVYVASVPGLPGSLSLVAGAGSLTASWTAAAANGAPVTGYHVTIQRSGSSTILSRDLNGSQLSTTFTGLVNSATYTVKVRAANAAGPGPIAVKTGIPGFLATLTGKVSTTLVTAGNGVTISGTLKRGTTAVAFRTIRITIDPLVGATITRTATTTSSGFWSYRYYPAYTFAARPRFSGDGVYRSAEGPLLKVSTAVRITRTSPANLSRSSSASTLTIRGTVFPSKPGRYVYLYRYVNGGRTLVARTTTTSSSTFAFVSRPGRGTYTLRVYMSATVGNAAGYSAPFTIYRT